MTNEQLCIAALDGDTEARNALVENNLRFIKRTAYEIWNAQQELNNAFGIEINDLVQEGSLGLLDCIAGYRPDTGKQVSNLCSIGDSQRHGGLHTQL